MMVYELRHGPQWLRISGHAAFCEELEFS